MLRGSGEAKRDVGRQSAFGGRTRRRPWWLVDDAGDVVTAERVRGASLPSDGPLTGDRRCGVDDERHEQGVIGGGHGHVSVVGYTLPAPAPATARPAY